MERAEVCPHWNRHLTPDVGLPILHAVLLPRLPSVDSQNALSTVMVFHTALPLTKSLTSWLKKCGSGLMLMGFTGHSQDEGPYHPEAARLIEQWNGLLKSQLQRQLDDNTLQGWDKVLQKAIYALHQHPIHDTVSPIARIHGSRDQGVEVEVAPPTITPSDPVATFLLSVPAALRSAGLEVFVPEEGTQPPGDTQLKVKIATWTLWAPPTFKSTG
nr:uncharacterized protein LOC123569092 [Macaca fascicularis]